MLAANVRVREYVRSLPMSGKAFKQVHLSLTEGFTAYPE